MQAARACASRSGTPVSFSWSKRKSARTSCQFVPSWHRAQSAGKVWCGSTGPRPDHHRCCLTLSELWERQAPNVISATSRSVEARDRMSVVTPLQVEADRHRVLIVVDEPLDAPGEIPAVPGMV